MPEDDPIDKNPLVRFKKHVDRTIITGLQSILGLPSLVTQSFVITPTPRPTYNAQDLAAIDRIHNKLKSGEALSAEQSSLCWRVFLSQSPYSPFLLDLEHNLNDLKHSGPSDATWVDAFDDLITVSSGLPHVRDDERFSRPATELHHLNSNDLLWYIGQHAHYWEQRRMAETFFPVFDPFEMIFTPRTIEEWISLRRVEQQWDRLQHQFSPFWGGERGLQKTDWKAVWESNQRIRDGHVESAEDRIDENVIQTLKDADKMREITRDVMPPKELDMDRSNRVEQPQSETEEDAHLQVQKAIEAERPSWTDWVDIAKEAWEAYRELERISKGSEGEKKDVRSETRTTQLPDGNTKVTTTLEYVDKDGTRHSEVEQIVKDRDGTVIQRIFERHATSESSWGQKEGDKKRDANVTATQKFDEEGLEKTKNGTQDGNGNGKPGWFWR